MTKWVVAAVLAAGPLALPALAEEDAAQSTILFDQRVSVEWQTWNWVGSGSSAGSLGYTSPIWAGAGITLAALAVMVAAGAAARRTVAPHATDQHAADPNADDRHTTYPNAADPNPVSAVPAGTADVGSESREAAAR